MYNCTCCGFETGICRNCSSMKGNKLAQEMTEVIFVARQVPTFIACASVDILQHWAHCAINCH